MNDAIATDTEAAAPTSTKPGIVLRTQYIKDVSFESPRAPASLFTTEEAPNVEVTVNLGAQRLEPLAVELSFQIAVRAVADRSTLFLIDLSYAGIFELRNMPEEALEEAIFIGGAQLLFPYARRLVSDLTRDGGFPPIQLEAMDFAAMYADQKSRAPTAAPETAQKRVAETDF